MSTTVVDEEFGTRLRLIMQQFGSVADLARAVGVSDNAIYKWVTGRGNPGMLSLVNLAKAAGVSVEWLATGRGQPLKARPEVRLEPSANLAKPPTVSPRRPGNKAGLSSPQLVDYLNFKPEWLKRIFNTEMQDVALIEVVGDSMSPTIDDGDLVVADTRETRFKSDGIYVIRNGEDLSIKRVQREPDGKLTIRSDNQAYHTMTIAPNALNFVGRVLWTGGRV
jgi:phage repressor protein C with HTH and peptisase S24 domain